MGGICSSLLFSHFSLFTLRWRSNRCRFLRHPFRVLRWVLSILLFLSSNSDGGFFLLTLVIFFLSVGTPLLQRTRTCPVPEVPWDPVLAERNSFDCSLVCLLLICTFCTVDPPLLIKSRFVFDVWMGGKRDTFAQHLLYAQAYTRTLRKKPTQRK